MLISLVGFYVFVNKETLERLIQINIESKEQIKELLGITRRSVELLIINTILISAIVMKITSKKLLQPIEKMTDATKKVASGDFNVKLETQREDENLPEAERKEYAEIIIEESNRLLNLSTNILRLSKIQNQSCIAKKENINIT